MPAPMFTPQSLLYPANDPNLFGPGGTISAGADPNVSIERRKKKVINPGDPAGFYQRQVGLGQEAIDASTPFQFITDTGQGDFGAIYSGLYGQPYVSPNAPSELEKNFGKTTQVAAETLDPLLSGKEDYSYLLQPAKETGEQNFQDLLTNINAPSSVDEVQRMLESDVYQQALAEIDRQTGQDEAAVKMNALERGLGGPGQMSDIEANALAQARAGGGRNKALARTTLAQSELARQKAKEDAVRSAYGERYKGGLAADTQARDIASRGLETLANLSSAEKRQYFSDLLQQMLQNIKLGQERTQGLELLQRDREKESNQNALQWLLRPPGKDDVEKLLGYAETASRTAKNVGDTIRPG